MRREDFRALKQKFNDYVAGFYDINNQLEPTLQDKLDHILRVADNCVNIINLMDLGKSDDLFLAEICGLYHDIGRFSQFKAFNTFNDKISVNHGLQGFKVISSENMLNMLSDEEVCIILNSVRFHNALKIPYKLPERSQFFTNIVRDADKLDIINMVNKAIIREEIFDDKSTVWNLEFDYLNPEIVQAIINNKIAKYSDVKNATDVCFMQLSWIYDMNFKSTLHILAELKVIENIEKIVPIDENTKITINHLKAYLNTKLK